ncbi:alpha-amylase family glycosyl hydrolase [Litoribacter populi]|uniref:alpha-amylase family glycosyl hydrolase n=1 Tax=Litoribacter populi TaxID=2598460 RepID=UPI001180684F|nr:alpha-amylase family glycosyl hydrolase [Litoribacter populi]
MDKNWYKEAIIYGVDVKLFQDSNNDGFGDFQGLTQRLDYLVDLGINCLWVMPFYPSPLRDYGYDVKDFLNIDSRLGNMDDFLNFIDACQEKNIRVIIDLVINHTSVEHPWFIQSKSYRNSPYRDYYVWRDEKPEEDDQKIMFEGVEDSVWEYAAETNSYYLHSYYKEQADLNFSNPKVKKEIFKVIKFWLQLGVSGFRIDAAHTLIDTNSISNYNNIFKEIREYSEGINPEAILLGEADVSSDQIKEFFGKGDRIHMLFNFFTNQYLFLALAQEKGSALAKGLDASDYSCGHSLNFVRHHDELNILQLSDKDRKEVLHKFAPEPNMRVFNEGGIKRELVSMMENDINRIKLVYVSIFGIPGSPMLHFGEELGMGEDLNRNLRAAVRIPMQWNSSLHGGFSQAPMEKICYPPLSQGPYSYKNINVELHQKDKGSIYHFIVNLIKLRKDCIEIGYGKWERLKLSDELLSIIYAHDGKRLLVVLNFSSKKQKVRLPDDLQNVETMDELADKDYKAPATLIEVNGYGYRWIRINVHKKVI